MALYIEKINGDVNQPTDRQVEYRAICLFRKLETRKKAEICNDPRMLPQKSSLKCKMRLSQYFDQDLHGIVIIIHD